jgi:cytochrome c-type biogenesis protein CcmH
MAPPAGVRQIKLQVSVASVLQGRFPPETTLFIAVRDPTQPGPPLAVQRRRAGELPLAVELSDADAMLPGRDLSHAAGPVTVVARISSSGTPTPTSGDLFGELTYAFDKNTPLKLTIDQVVP